MNRTGAGPSIAVVLHGFGGCGFCAGICPCGVWEMVENV